MIALYDQIQELRLELRGCYMTRRELAEAHAELNRLVSRLAELGEAPDCAFAAHIQEGR